MRDPVRALVHVRHLARPIVVDADAHRLIDEGELAAVGRPLRCVPEAGPERRDLALRPRNLRGAQRQLVLAAAIAPVGDRLAVRRPARISIRDAGGTRQVERRAAFRRDRHDVAAGLEDGAAAGRRHGRTGDQFVGPGGPRAQRRGVRHDAHRHFGHALARQTQQVQASAGLKHDGVWTHRRKCDVEVVELRDLPNTPGPEVLRPDVVALARSSIGQEIDRVAAPHRLSVVRRIVRDIPRGEGFQIEHEQVRRPAAAISLPVAEVLRHRHVDEARTVGRERTGTPRKAPAAFRADRR